MSPIQEQCPLVLAVEENPAISRLLVLALARDGFRVVPVSSRAEGVEILQTSFQAAINVVLIDQGTSWPGWQATLLALRQLNPFLRCGILGNAAGLEKEEILTAGACLLPKPFRLEALAAFVRNLHKEVVVAGVAHRPRPAHRLDVESCHERDSS